MIPQITCGRVRAMPRLCVFYPGICLTTEENIFYPLETINVCGGLLTM